MPDRARRLVMVWLGHPDVRPFIRVNAWEGQEWFGREEWRELLDWALLLDRIDASLPGDAADGWPVVRRLLELGEGAGYRVDRLRDLVAPARRPSKGSKPARGARPDTRPGARAGSAGGASPSPRASSSRRRGGRSAS